VLYVVKAIPDGDNRRYCGLQYKAKSEWPVRSSEQTVPNAFNIFEADAAPCHARNQKQNAERDNHLCQWL
jgi:hypothetical protein